MELIKDLINSLNVCEVERLKANEYINEAFFNNGIVDVDNLQKEYKWFFKEGFKKFSKINCGSSGAFMLENTTGELFNIKGYGTPDYNKKKKANIGNVKDCFFNDLIDINKVKLLHSKRHNYLR